MAIQISGTTVVNNSRELQNIASLDATTAATIGAVAGGSTTFGDVGTYVFACHTSTSANYFVAGSTYAGSNLYPSGISVRFAYYDSLRGYYFAGSNNTIYRTAISPTALSGTWRAMGETTSHQDGDQPQTLFVRIS